MRLLLPERLQASQAEELLVQLRAAATQGEDLELDGSGVQKVDTAGLQLLVSLGKSVPAWRWAAPASPALVSAARLLGLAEPLKVQEAPLP